MDYTMFDVLWKKKKDHIKNQIDREFFVKRTEMKSLVFNRVTEMLTPLPVHYEYSPPDYFCGKAAALIPNGHISLNQTLGEFLLKEYDGSFIPPGEEDDGKLDYTFPTFESRLNLLNDAADIIFNVASQLIKEELGIGIDRYQAGRIVNHWDGFDDEFDRWLYLYMDTKRLIEYLEISDIPLKDILSATEDKTYLQENDMYDAVVNIRQHK